MTLAEKEATLVDTVTYENLVPGVEYTVDGVLVDQSNSAEVATGHTTFTPDSANGTVTVTFKVNASLLKNHTVVAFETLKSNGAKIAEHCDIHDAAQSTRVPMISTSAVVGKQYDYIPPAPAKPDPSVTNWITVTSTVKYENLEPGVEYTITSTLTDPKTGDLILDASGNVITASTTFVPETPNGEVTLTYTFEAPVDWEADIEPEFSGYIWYELAETTKNIYGNKGALIVDTVTYQNLVRGLEYTVKGTLMDKSTGKPLLDAEGQPITAEKIFTAPSANGTVDIEFMLDAGENQGKSLVVFEELTVNGAVVAEHKDLNDPAQTLYVPELDTVAVDGKTSLHMAMQCSGMTITDTVNYTAVEPGKDYVIRGTLMDKDTQSPLLDNAGHAIVVEKAFTATASKGSITLEFVFENFNLAGKTIVVFEELLEDNFVIGEHKDLNDEDQTVHIPKLETSLVDDKTGMHIAYAEDGATVTDTVTFTNLIPGMIYQLRGTLVDSVSGESVATAKMNFRPETANGTVTITYTFDASKLAGRSVVAYEELYAYCTELVARHQDINDPEQTVRIPGIDTVASSATADTKSLEISADAAIKDVITYTNLIPNQTYTVTARLMDAETGEQLGDEVQATFVAPSANGIATLTLHANTLGMGGKSIVMFESIALGGKLVASHEDLNDADQTVSLPAISTSAADKATDLKYAAASETFKVKDTVSYKGLQPGKEYRVTGYMVSKSTGAKISDEVSVTFKPVAAEGTVDVIIPVNTSRYAGTDIVAYETLFEGDIAIVEHKNIDDDAQTIHIASIATTATDVKTGSHMALAENEMKLTDSVVMKNLQNGAKYELTTVLVNRTTAEIVTVDGAESLVNTFTADSVNVTVKVDVTLTDYNAAGCDLVFYEYLRMVTDEGAVLMASHEDAADADQTVNVPFISTALIDATTSTHQLAATQTLVEDTVTYKNLIPGETYTVTGKLVDKATGEDLLDADGNAVVATTTFVPESENGTVVVSFEIDGKAIESDALVCYETMSWNDYTIAVHQDINDENQTVRVPRIKTVLHIDGDKNTGVGGTITIVDDVYYYNLLPGYTYRINGTLMDKATGEPRLDSMGNPYTGTVTFVASETGDGIEHVTFIVNTNDMADGATLVAFERLQMVLKADVRGAAPSMADAEGNDLVIGPDGDGAIDIPVDAPVDKGIPSVGENPSEPAPTDPAPTDPVDPNPTDPQPTDPDDPDMPVEPGDGDGDGDEEPGIDIGDDSDLGNGDQTVVVDPVEISTVATDANGGKEIYAVSDARIIDTVSYKNLRVGETYKLISTLIDWATMEPVTDAEGNAVVISTEFTPEQTEGTVQVQFVFDATGLNGGRVVVYQKLYNGDDLIASEQDILNKDQTVDVKFAFLRTEAKVGESKETFAEESTVITDTVTYEGLQPGTEYTLKGELYDFESVASIGVTAETKFTPNAESGSATVTFTVDTSAMAGRTIVVFEDLYQGDGRVAFHRDITDAMQSIVIKTKPVEPAKMATELTANGGHEVVAGIVEMKDTVTYTNLEAGTDYIVYGRLVVKSTGEEIAYVMNPFTPNDTFGTLTVDFGEIDTTSYGDDDIVAFEVIKLASAVEADGADEAEAVVSHEDINDVQQTVHIVKPAEPPKLSTELIACGKHEVEAGDSAMLDVLTYSGLEAGTEYIVYGRLVVKSTGEEIAFRMMAFTPENGFGTLLVDFGMVDLAKYGDDAVVAFEVIKKAGSDEVVVSHEDIEDLKQTVTVTKPIEPPTLSTELTADGTHDVVAGKVTMTDVLTYTGLEAGREYVAYGRLIVKSTGEEIAFRMTPFTPEDSFGTLMVEFGEVDLSKYGDDAIVAMEVIKLADSDEVVVAHEDIEDIDQTTTVTKPVEPPTLSTELTANGGHEVTAGAATVTDVLTYTGLEAGTEYVVYGKLVLKSTGEEVAFRMMSFTPEDTFGTLLMEFGEIDLSAYGDDVIVAIEIIKLPGEDEVIVGHEDLNDENQTVAVMPAPIPEPPTLSTELTANGSHEVTADKVTVTDTLIYTGLEAGKEYVAYGKLVLKSTGEEIAYRMVAFTTDDTFGVLAVEFGEVDLTKYGDDAVVAIEVIKLAGSDEVVVAHEDMDDKYQTVTLLKPVEPPTLSTELTANGTHELTAGVADVTDILTYTGLEAGEEYVAYGRLILKSTGEEIAYRMMSFRAEDTFGILSMNFGAIDLTKYGDDAIVATEVIKLADTDEIVVAHEDMEDADQTVTLIKPAEPPTLSTELTADGKHEATAGKVDVTDTLIYTGLEAGNKYVVYGRLVLKSTGEEIAYRMMEFTADDTYMVLAMNFGEIDLSAYANDAIVALEVIKLADSDEIVVAHEDMEDADQTVTLTAPIIPDDPAPKPEATLSTELTDDLTGCHQAALGKTSFTDVLSYENLDAGVEYTLISRLVNRETGEVLATLVNKFTPSATNGTYEVKFTDVDTTQLAGALVAFETIELDGETIVAHEDKDDAAQTVYIGSASTKLTGKDGSSKNVDLSNKVTIVDLVKYTNLIPGKTYTVKALLHDVAAGEGRYIAAQTLTFTPDKADGAFEVKFVMDTTEYAQHELVMTEEIFLDDVLVIAHNDLTDKDQTVVVQSKANVGTAIVNNSGYIAMGFGIIAIAIAAVYFVLNRKKKSEQQ